MRRKTNVIVALILVVIAIYFVLQSSSITPSVGPSRTNFKRIQIGMTFNEVENVLGPAGPSTSSMKWLGKPNESQYTWRGENGNVHVWILENRVIRKEFEPKENCVVKFIRENLNPVRWMSR